MEQALKGVKLVFLLALFTAAPVFAQAPAAAATPETTASPVAYVYVQTFSGVNLYDAAADGKLTLVKGSPFTTTGQMVGSNGKYFVSAGTNLMHAYSVESSGAIGKQVSEIDTQAYVSAACKGGTGTASANLDHTGQQLYVELNLPGSCEFLQSFNIGKNSGELTYAGITDAHNNPYPYGLGQVISLTGNDKFAIVGPSPISAFERESNGALDSVNSFSERDPTPTISGALWSAMNVKADPTNHLAVSGFEYVPKEGSNEQVGPFQIGSYTVDASGDIATTNTLAEMPKSTVLPETLNMSPSGKLLAVAGTYNLSNYGYDGEAGLQVFHFDGAAPIKTYGKPLLSGVPIYFIRWDNSNHLYAVSDKLYVFTVTPTSVSQSPGSPYALPPLCQGERCSWGLTVVPKL
jgi:hypothetical protein